MKTSKAVISAIAMIFVGVSASAKNKSIDLRDVDSIRCNADDDGGFKVKDIQGDASFKTPSKKQALKINSTSKNSLNFSYKEDKSISFTMKFDGTTIKNNIYGDDYEVLIGQLTSDNGGLDPIFLECEILK
jgi:hypothetical protein